MPGSGDRPQKYLLARSALEGGMEFYQAFTRAFKSGLINAEDPRARADVINPKASIKESTRAFVAEAGAFHEVLRDNAASISQEAHFRPALALQNKIIKSTFGGTDMDDFSIGALAMSFEDCGLDLIERGGNSRLARDLFRFASRGADRVVLGERHKAFDGLIASVSLSTGLSQRHACAGLLRAGLIESGDPRVAAAAEPKRAYNRFTTPEFSSHINACYWGNMHLLRPSKSTLRGRKAVLGELANLPSRPDREENEAEKMARHTTFMGVVARVGERMALNIGWKRDEQTRQLASDMMETAGSAIDRRSVYADRLRAAEASRDTSRKTELRDRDETLM